MDYLVEGLTPRVWRERNVMGVVPYRDSYAEYDLLLSTYAVFGLAVSGHPRAGEALRTLWGRRRRSNCNFETLKEPQ